MLLEARSQEINGLILAAILIYMIVLVNDRRIMGRYANGPLANVLGGVVLVVLSVVTVLFLASFVAPRLFGG